MFNSLSVCWSWRTRRIDNAERFISVKIEELCRIVSNSKGRYFKRKPSNILKNDDVFLVTRNFMRCVWFLEPKTVSCHQLEVYRQIHESMIPKWFGCSSFGYAFSLHRERALLKRDEHYSMLYESSDTVRNLFGSFNVLICGELPDHRREVIEWESLIFSWESYHL